MKSKANIHLELGKLATALVLTVAATGCGQPTKVGAKSPTPVHLADVAMYSSSEGLRYSASVLPFAEATLSFKPRDT
jgi:hypothetical protein